MLIKMSENSFTLYLHISTNSTHHRIVLKDLQHFHRARWI